MLIVKEPIRQRKVTIAEQRQPSQEAFYSYEQDKQLQSMLTVFDSAVKEAIALENLNETLKASLESKNITPSAVMMINIAKRDIYSQLGIKTTRNIAVESFNGKRFDSAALQLSIEENDSTLKRVWDAIVAFFKKIAKWISEKFDMVKARVSALRKKSEQVKAIALKYDSENVKTDEVQSLLPYYLDGNNINATSVVQSVEAFKSTVKKFVDRSIFDAFTDFRDFHQLIVDKNSYERFNPNQVLGTLKEVKNSAIVKEVKDSAGASGNYKVYYSGFPYLTDKSAVYVIGPDVNKMPDGALGLKELKKMRIAATNLSGSGKDGVMIDRLSPKQVEDVTSTVIDLLKSIEDFSSESDVITKKFDSFSKAVSDEYVSSEKETHRSKRAVEVLGALMAINQIQSQAIARSSYNMFVVLSEVITYAQDSLK